ncbi:molybdate-anion transporter-like [Neodiprion pinetum]|uniref:Molybdate-anion transporter n=1 Tax=Neodiprion lecontei TaxID=441921 RepID=A0A6J0C9Y3_NEOLC|nr:molybdate-anion transporter-like [Neodiprion lecontei]XP_046465506.1 molybdate-anion transporter-like [Neodiprion pinetum]XP_046465515.1 molybdate-anion transporter-like [Neodiprion pinetum]XP_046587881.1 molybdate-anion transporter-like [Neodiprion lecontei]
MDMELSDKLIYSRLCRKYLLVFLLATFADWLQGPYIYRLYTHYGYSSADVLLLYVVGFASSTAFGIVVGYLADKFGRKKLCVIYSILYSLACLLKIYNSFSVLFVGRILGGISTSILFSTFESWYIGQHLIKYDLEKDWINLTLTKSTFYNGLLAILAGFVSSIFVDKLDMGPLAPFLLAVPILVAAGYSCAILWDENPVLSHSFKEEKYESSLTLIINKHNRILLYLGIVQSLYESVMYVFVFLWTPVLEPIHPSQGVIFSFFMMCIMLGSYFYTVLHSRFRLSCERLLNISILVSFFSISMCTYGSYIQTDKSSEVLGTYLCLFSFLCYEVAIGIYYPAIGYLRGIVIPETHRASIINWFRVPMNLMTCAILLYVRFKLPYNYQVFLFSAASLSVACYSSSRFVNLYNTDLKYSQAKITTAHPNILLL